MNQLDVYEHGRLIIDEEVFTRKHWKAFVKLNTVQDGAYFDVLHNGLKFKQYVGVLQVDGLLVHIHPKADKDDDDSRWKGVLLQMLKACGKVKAQTAGNARLKKQNINLLEVYFEYYLKEMEGLIHAGLVKKYRKETSNVKALKGKLEFAGNIRKNLVHKERFYTTHQVYDANHKLHQVLNHALEIVSQFTRATRLNDKCRRVQLAFPDVDMINPTAQNINAIKIDRKTAPYERALELAKFIILNYSPDINRGQQKMIALLFNMNELWEEYVLKMLKRYSREHPEKCWSVHGQESKRFYGSYRTIRPDIVLRRGDEENEETFVVDTKWKRPTNKSASIEDLRQMYAYGRFWDSDKLMLLYPGELYDSGYEHYPNKHDQNRKHQCKIGRVSVLDESSLDVSIAEKIIGLIEN
ncbi:MAG: restriction endonuclease [Crocinitomicaceae bacterium]|nr:restriction endonuclease [Crocinitomicaceae bacterium]